MKDLPIKDYKLMQKEIQNNVTVDIQSNHQTRSDKTMKTSFTERSEFTPNSLFVRIS